MNKFGGPDYVVVGFGDWSHNALRNQPPTMSIGLRRALRALGGYRVFYIINSRDIATNHAFPITNKH